MIAASIKPAFIALILAGQASASTDMPAIDFHQKFTSHINPVVVHMPVDGFLDTEDSGREVSGDRLAMPKSPNQ